MRKVKVSYNMYDCFLEGGQKIGVWEVLLKLNKLYEENEKLQKKIDEVISDE